ncbi:VOC family protein [Luteimonas deserti]|uniref:VOC family protein n=1 Tax=Luteimonas deserti TaxID=2752306 RepID=A0A7Z0QQQ8_9GAMM|nr:VOC family protein [Luteimonas deserti]NYZ61980.1 VOC family protein [Luteimonas deserti]
MRIDPYLYFDGSCAEAFAAYAAILGAPAPQLMAYAESPDGDCGGPDAAGRIMHAWLDLGAFALMGSDVPPGMPLPAGPHAFVSLGVDDDAQAERIFAALADGGAVRMPMESTFFAHRFGMLVDRFGTGWMVLHARACGDMETAA